VSLDNLLEREDLVHAHLELAALSKEHGGISREWVRVKQGYTKVYTRVSSRRVA